MSPIEKQVCCRLFQWQKEQKLNALLQQEKQRAREKEMQQQKLRKSVYLL